MYNHSVLAAVFAGDARGHSKLLAVILHNIEEIIIPKLAMKCFHAMLWVKDHIIDLMKLMRWKNRLRRPNRRYLLPKCYKFFSQWVVG